MRRRIFLTILVFFGCLSFRAKATTTVIINELMWMGSSVSTADEWIELRNPSDQAIDISGWQLTKYSNNQDVPMFTLPAGSSIAPHGFFVISNYAVGTHSILQNAPQVVNTDVALANTNLRIRLLDATGTVVDVAGDAKGTPFAGLYISAQKLYGSMERNPEPGDGASVGSWHTATKSLNLIPNSTELGTPGQENSNGQPQLVVADTFNGQENTPTHFDASDTIDPENDPLTFTWSIDGAGAVVGASVDISLTAGDHMGTVTVSDGTNTTSKQFTVHVSAVTTLTAAAPAVQGVSTSSCSGIHISEIFPDPKGPDTHEYVELVNATATELSLAGCHLLLNNARQYALPIQNMSAKAFLALQNQKWKLTNSGLTISLTDSDGTVLETVTYPKAKEGQSWTMAGDEWGWAKPTPQARNAALAAIPEGDKKESASASKKTATPIAIHGVVVAQTGLLGAQLAIVATGDDYQMVKTDKDVLLALGQRLDAEGVAGTHLGEQIVLLHGTVPNKKSAEPNAPSIQLGDVDWPDQYRLVTISGTVQALKGTSIALQDDSGDGLVALKTVSKIIRPAMQTGDHLTATGILSISTTGVKILPRQPRDLVVTPKQIPDIPQPVIAATKTLSPWWYWGAAGFGLGAVGLLQWRKSRSSSATA